MDQHHFEKMIENQFDHVKSDYQDIKKTLDKILEQTTATNGRLRSLETWRATSQGHWSGVSKTVTFIAAFIAFVGGIIATMLWH